MQPLFYRTTGKGNTIVLLHGFMETHQIWNEFFSILSADFNVIAFDLPGFGQSSLLADPFSISDAASVVLENLQQIVHEPVSLVGHSLGGYVSLAMVEQQPHQFKSLSLFHSTALADSLEKKEARTKTIDFVAKNGAQAFTANFVPPLFANPKHPDIERVTAMAMQANQQSVVSYLAAMRDRPDRTEVLRQFNRPILFLAGEADSVISADSLEKQSKMAKKSFFLRLDNVGHMGMLEALNDTVVAVANVAKLA